MSGLLEIRHRGEKDSLGKQIRSWKHEMMDQLAEQVTAPDVPFRFVPEFVCLHVSQTRPRLRT
jgi:hypothetical protein